jgi:hypothetical protein
MLGVENTEGNGSGASSQGYDDPRDAASPFISIVREPVVMTNVETRGLPVSPTACNALPLSGEPAQAMSQRLSSTKSKNKPVSGRHQGRQERLSDEGALSGDGKVEEKPLTPSRARRERDAGKSEGRSALGRRGAAAAMGSGSDGSRGGSRGGSGERISRGRASKGGAEGGRAFGVDCKESRAGNNHLPDAYVWI